jgi:hypothetical protein
MTFDFTRDGSVIKINKTKRDSAMRSFGGWFARVVLVFLVFVGVGFAGESVVTIDGVDNINTYINSAKAKDKTKLKKAITVANKFMKLYLGGDVCGCEPSMEDCNGKLQPLLDYPLFDPKLDKTCGVQGRNVGGVQGRDLKWEPHYAIDIDGHIVSIEFDNKNNTALFKYESTLIGIYEYGINGGMQGIALWDASVQGQKFKSEVKINLNNYKVIVASTQGDILPSHYKRLINYIKWLPEYMEGDFAKDWSNETKAKQYEMIKKILKDLDSYKSKNSKTQKSGR